MRRKTNAAVAIAVIGAIFMTYFMAFAAGTASAAQISGPPDSEGTYAQCSVGTTRTAPYVGAVAYTNWALCQFGPNQRPFGSTSIGWQLEYTPSYLSTTWVTLSCTGTWTQVRTQLWKCEQSGTTGATNQPLTWTGNFRRGPSWPCSDMCGDFTLQNGPGWTTSQNYQYKVRSAQNSLMSFSQMQEPPDWYAGGSGPIPAPPNPVVTCSRSLSDPNLKTAYFQGNATTVSGVTHSYSWDFGDSTTSTNQNPTKQYSGTLPDGGWTAILTVTATGNGTTYTATTATTTCSLRVDFLNPTAAIPGTNDQGQADDADCPSGWGWLNPAAIVTVMRCLFIPTNSELTGYTQLWGDVQTKAPFSWGYQAVTFIPSAFDWFNDGVTQTSTGTGCFGVAGGQDGGGSGASSLNLPLGSHIINQSPNIGVDTCTATNATWVGIVRTSVYVLFLFGLGLFVYEMVMKVIK